eukprot:5899090-Amphidinium_carterae.1
MDFDVCIEVVIAKHLYTKCIDLRQRTFPSDHAKSAPNGRIKFSKSGPSSKPADPINHESESS